MILAEDGSVRDLAGLSGTWRPIPATEQALSLVAQALAAAPLAEAHILLDEPVSNSGKLAGLYEEALKNLPIPSPSRSTVPATERSARLGAQPRTIPM